MLSSIGDNVLWRHIVYYCQTLLHRPRTVTMYLALYIHHILHNPLTLIHFSPGRSHTHTEVFLLALIMPSPKKSSKNHVRKNEKLRLHPDENAETLASLEGHHRAPQA